MSRCQFKLNESTSSIELILAGAIDETFSLQSLEINPTKELIINTEGIKQITSNGVREWIKFISKIPNLKIDFINCTKPFIDQVNSVNGFCPKRARIKSFYAPYFSKDANMEKNFLFTYDKDYTEKSHNIPLEFKDENGEVLVLDINENKYFKFMKRI